MNELEEKRKQIKELQAEVQRLENLPKRLTDYTSATMLGVFEDELKEYDHPSAYTPTHYAYEAMRKLCLALPFKTYNCRCGIYRKVRDLSQDECKMAGEMMDEIILIWNKYVKRVYEGSKDDE